MMMTIVGCLELGRDSWGGGFGSSYGGARGGGPMRGEYGSRDSGPYGGNLVLVANNKLLKIGSLSQLASASSQPATCC